MMADDDPMSLANEQKASVAPRTPSPTRNKDTGMDLNKTNKTGNGLTTNAQNLATMIGRKTGDAMEEDDVVVEESDEEEDDKVFGLEADDQFDKKNALMFTFRIERFKEVQQEWLAKYENGTEDAIKSPKHQAPDGIHYRLLVFPLGLPRDNTHFKKSLSCYVENSDMSSLLERHGDHWTKSIKYSIAVINHKKGQIIKDTGSSKEEGEDGNEEQVPKLLQRYEHKSVDSMDSFGKQNTDWGFTGFMDLKEITREGSGYLDQTGALVIQAVCIPKIDFMSYDSKAMTGRVGLENHGATCYLNSLLQTLYMTSRLRLDVYELDTSQDKANTGIGLELQRLFWQLQTSNTAVSTRSLTTAFGWSSAYLFRQHDVQEMNRELIDKLESRMKKTNKAGCIKNLYTGKTRSYIKCINVDYASERDEEFYDIQLDVKNMTSVHHAFKKYIEDDRLDGDNQYEAEGHGKQDALKGMKFLSFPPVLNLHLKRFEYDLQTGLTVKINDLFTFPVRLKLDQYLHEAVPEEERTQYDYVLHSVLVHVGDVNSGHYYAFINDMEKQKEIVQRGDLGGTQYKSNWFRFDDERVTATTKKQAVNHNFGGRRYDSYGNAYMLVYIQVSHLDDVLVDIPESAIPPALVERFKSEDLAQRQKREDEEKRRNSLMVYYATNKDVARNCTFGRNPVKHRQHVDFVNFAEASMTVISKGKTCKDLYQQIALELNTSPDRIRLWECVDRKNNTNRPDGVLRSSDNLLQNHESKQLLRLYVEQAHDDVEDAKVNGTDHEKTNGGRRSDSLGDMEIVVKEEDRQVEPSPKRTKYGDDLKSAVATTAALNGGIPSHKHMILLFFRQFDPYATTEEEKVIFRREALVDSNATGEDLLLEYIIPMFGQKYGGTENPDDFLVWELISPRDIKPVKPDSVLLSESEIQNGDIIVFTILSTDKMRKDYHEELRRKEEKKRKEEDADMESNEDEDESGENGVTPSTPPPPPPAFEKVSVVDGVYNKKTPANFTSFVPTEYMRYLNARMNLALMPFGSRNSEDKIVMEISFLAKYFALQKVAAQVLYTSQTVDESKIDRLFNERIRFHVASAAFTELENAYPLTVVQSDTDTTIWKMVNIEQKSIWREPSGDDVHVVFYEILPCIATNHENVFEVYVLDGKYPHYKPVLVSVDPKSTSAPDNGFTLIGDQVLEAIGLETDEAMCRFIVTEGLTIDKILSPNDNEDPKLCLPSVDEFREGYFSQYQAMFRKFVVCDVIRLKDEDPSEAVTFDSFHRRGNFMTQTKPKIVEDDDSNDGDDDEDDTKKRDEVKVTGKETNGEVKNDNEKKKKEEKGKIVGVAHSTVVNSGKPSRVKRFGMPFSLIVYPGDTKPTIMKKVKQRLRLSDEEMDGWELAVLYDDPETYELITNDTEILSENRLLFPSDNLPKTYLNHARCPMLGILHPKQPVSNGATAMEAFAEVKETRKRNNSFGRSPIISNAAIS